VPDRDTNTHQTLAAAKKEKQDVGWRGCCGKSINKTSPKGMPARHDATIAARRTASLKICRKLGFFTLGLNSHLQGQKRLSVGLQQTKFHHALFSLSLTRAWPFFSFDANDRQLIVLCRLRILLSS